MPGKHIYAIMTGFAFLIAPSLFAQQKPNYRNMPIVDSAVGVASYYADKFIGRKTASGEIFSQHKMTCAHNTLPFGTKVKVTNLRNGKSIIVRVNDRLHHRNPRIVDLPTGAAKKLGYTGRGIIKVSVVVVKPPVIKPANAD
ncbi:MAG: septal ring lytic transglycosylase RlpA family protein [Chitinophagaceae bacterium]|jgi:rare lipoprotein A